MMDKRGQIPITRRAALVGGVGLLAGCTVRPLHLDTASGPSARTAPLAAVSVAEVGDRIAQQVRNHLIFLLYQGGEASSAPTHSARITATPSVQDVFVTTAPDGSTGISAKRVTLTGTLTLTRIADGTVVADARRSATTSFDNTRQEFANLRAARDAEDRAAAELAERFRIVIAAALAGR